ncbi:helix-turn-helix domain-containing protein [Candidatus Uhrbacteria bacterium]|nr:helix-turn-helix domain-containing protein [Candidatus Uhrbacteria bacterium]
MNQPDNVIRLSISEAGRIFGVNPQTIRRAIKAREVTYVVVRGRYKLNFESILKWSQKHAGVKNKLQNRGIGQFVSGWKINNPLYSPNPAIFKKTNDK